MIRAKSSLVFGVVIVSLLSITLSAATFAANSPAAKKSADPSRATQAAETDNDQTLHAMRDEMARSVSRLQIPGAEKPFYIQYQLLDVDTVSYTHLDVYKRQSLRRCKRNSIVL